MEVSVRNYGTVTVSPVEAKTGSVFYTRLHFRLEPSVKH